MTVEINQQDLSNWTGFFDQAGVEPDFLPQSGAPFSTFQCTNHRFGDLHFSSAKNSDTHGFNTQDVVVDASVLMALDAGDSSKPLGDLLLTAGLSPDQLDPAGDSANLFVAVVSKIGKAISFKLDKAEQRNAMWLTPGNTMRMDTALTYVPDLTGGNQLNLSDIAAAIVPDLGLSSLSLSIHPLLIIQHTVQGVSLTTQASTQSATPDPATIQWEMTYSYRVSFKIAAGDFIFWITVDASGMSVSLTKDPDFAGSSLWSSLTRLGVAFSISPKPDAEVLGSNIDLAQLIVGRDASGRAWWQVTATISLRNSAGSDGAVDLYLTYNSLTSTFAGGLITSAFYATEEDKLSPDYAPGLVIDLPVGKTYSDFWSLKNLFSTAVQEAIPNSIPLDISYALVSLTTGNPKSIAFIARAIHATQSPAPTEDSSTLAPFVWDELDVSFTASKATGANPIISCSLSTFFTLNPPPHRSYPSAGLSLLFSYNDGDWLLHGHAENLSVGLLHSFFEKDSSSALIGMLGDLNIASLDLILTHSATGALASFLFTGVITLEGLELRLFYQYATTSVQPSGERAIDAALENAGTASTRQAPTGGQQTTWVFECDLGASTQNATIGSIANSFVANSAGDMPSFIAKIGIPQADGSQGRTPIYLKARKIDGLVLFALSITIGAVSVLFVQVAPVTSQSASDTPPTPPKRLIRFSVSKLPFIDKVPLLNTLPQPFDLLEYVWVSKAGDSGGFLKSEIDSVNDNLLHASDTLKYKASVKTDSATIDNPARPAGETTSKPDPTADPVVLTEGHHFIVIHGGEVVVDHPFLTGSTTSSSGEAKKSSSRMVMALESPPTPPPSAPSKGPLSFKLGPLAIDGLALQFKEQSGKKALAITMNGTFTMGPMSFGLLGFGLAIDLEDLTLDKLPDAASHISVVLSGLALAFNKPPVLVAGGFEHAIIQIPGGTEEIFQGGIGISFPPYTFIGLGEYAIVKVNGTEYKSVFLFAKLDGPIITLEFATISGLRIGLGYNSAVRAPDVNEITDFPFINDGSIQGTGNDPMAILKNMTGGSPPWVAPKLDSYWFAAGMSVVAFDILTVTAVALFAFGDTGLDISIYADAIAQMPPNAPKEAVIVYVEIGLVAEMNFIDGYFRVEASLAPTSFLLVPECHLYGGFALVYWFPPSDHSGDWVFSVGGYHRSYTPPPWYPVPRRLGISFNVDIVSITGEAYFAITPKCVMGGAMIHASLSLGPLNAWLDATFDALIQYHPLHYTVDFQVSIGVEVDIDVLFVHIHISAHIGAQLHIEGPEFGGTAHVDFWFMGFDFDFGASPQQPPPLDLLQFWEMLHKMGPDQSSGSSGQHQALVSSLLTYGFTSQDPDHKISPATFPGAALKFSLEDGNFPLPSQPDTSATKGDPSSTGTGSKWYVKGGSFRFRISTDLALSDTTLEKNKEEFDNEVLAEQAAAKKENRQPNPISPVHAQTSPDKVFSKPMHLTEAQGKMTSTLAVTVVYQFDGEIIDNFRAVNFVVKPVPTAVWDPYDAATDPKLKPDGLLNGANSTTNQCMGVAFEPPLPFLSPPVSMDGLGLFIPKFKATAAMKFGILDFRVSVNGTDWFVPVSEPVQTQYIPSELKPAQQQKSNADKWAGMRDTWNGLKSKSTVVNAAKTGVLATFASTLGWDKDRPQTEVRTLPKRSDGRKPWELLGGVPSKLVKNLEAAYLDLPRVGVVSA